MKKQPLTIQREDFRIECAAPGAPATIIAFGQSINDPFKAMDFCRDHWREGNNVQHYRYYRNDVPQFTFIVD